MTSVPRADPITVTLLTGFLGSGKTTVLNHLLRELPLTAVVMNEFGEIGLDHQLLEESRGPLALLSGGCVCCQIQGSLAPTLKNLWMGRDKGDLPPFQRLIIETTGIADPAPVVATLAMDRWLATRYRLDGIVTTVDAQFADLQLDQHFEAVQQVAVADRLLLTKADLTSEAAITHLRARLETLNPAAPLLDVRHGVVEPAAILGAGLTGSNQRPSDPTGWLAASRYRPAESAQRRTSLAKRPNGVPSHDDRIRAFSLQFDTPLDWQGVSAALEMLVSFRPKNLLRMKAILNLSGQSLPTVLHAVQHVLYPPTQLATWPDEDRRSRFVFILCDMEAAFVAKLLEDFTQTVTSAVISTETSQVRPFPSSSTMA